MVGERGFEPPTPWSRTRSQRFFEFGEEREREKPLKFWKNKKGSKTSIL
jgi:hypothetical protein